MCHIAVLVQRGQRLSPASLLGQLADIWQQRGLRVSMLDGPVPGVMADALVLHVSLTVVPSEYLRYIERFPIVINARVADISKRLVSRNLVERDTPYDGPVIVKTNRNFRGVVESESMARAGVPQRLLQALRNRLPWSLRSALEEYPIFESPRQVPAGVWHNRDLVVERFLAERKSGDYCLRTWLFLGDQERIALFHSREPVVKSHNIIGRELLTDVPDELRALRRELGFDFGKFDFAIVDGRPVLYDANRTPTLGNVSKADSNVWLETLADGLWSFLPKPPL
jgi:hypothetical protein